MTSNVILPLCSPADIQRETLLEYGQLQSHHLYLNLIGFAGRSITQGAQCLTLEELQWTFGALAFWGSLGTSRCNSLQKRLICPLTVRTFVKVLQRRSWKDTSAFRKAQLKRDARLQLICLIQDLEDERGSVTAAFPEALSGMEKHPFGILCQVLIRYSAEKKAFSNSEENQDIFVKRFSNITLEGISCDQCCFLVASALVSRKN